MKLFELQPTEENILKTFLEDTISRNNDVFYFVNILNSLDKSFSISLDGAWGSGKTFFVKQVKMVIDAYNDFIKLDDNKRLQIQKKVDPTITTCQFQTQVCVYYDAWANDSDEDPILSLVYSIVQSIKTDFSFKKEQNYLDWSVAFLEIVELFSHTHLSKIISTLKEKKLISQEDVLSEIKDKKDIQNIIKEFFDSLLLEKGDRLIIFIDELDRCRPDFAVRVLERIKHYFTDDRITFVFSVNAKELQHTIKSFYGSNFDGYKYLDRFFDLRIALPQVDINQYYYDVDNDLFNNISNIVIKEYKFELREISKYFYHIKCAKNKISGEPYSPSQKGFYFGVNYIVPVMIGLMMYNINMYQNFIDGSDNSQLIQILSKLDGSFFGLLLKSNEKFSKESLKSEGEFKFVTLEEKISEVYTAVFGDRIGHFPSVGLCTFEKGLKEKLIGIINLLSPYADVLPHE